MSIPWIWENLPTSDNTDPGRRHPLGAGSFDLLSCAAVCTGDLRDQTHRHLHPLALGRKRRRASAAQWAALTPATAVFRIRCGRTPRHCHAHHIIHWKDGGRTDLSKPGTSLVRDVTTTAPRRYTITMDTHTIPVITHTRGTPETAARKVGGR